MPSEEQIWMDAGGWLSTVLIPSLIGMYIGWKILAWFTKSKEPDKPEDDPWDEQK